MKEGRSDIERRILAELQGGLPKGRSPYKDVAQQVGIDTAELLGILQEWKQEGKIRRIGAIVNHFKVGLAAGGMVVWKVEADRSEEVGGILAGFAEVSHAYERRVSENWSYRLYTMVHGESSEEVERTVKRMSDACGVSDYRILVTERELKKASPTYIKKDG